MQPERGTLSRQKDAVVMGTYESNAFVLSLRRRDEFATTHSFGYHRVPHIGVYGADYSLAVPMALLSLPVTPRYLQRLPQEILNALDLGHLMGTLTSTPPPSPCHVLSQRVISNLHSHHDHSRDQQLREIARELVQFAITSAMGKLGLTQPSIMPGSDQHPAMGVQYSDLACQEKQLSVVSMDSIEEHEETVKPHRSVSFQVESTVIEEAEFEEEWSEEEEEEEEEEDALRLRAKKIVKKAVHLACKRWESMHRRSSIDYLIASTKRLKIASPSPPPALPEEERAPYEDGVAIDPLPQGDWDTPSPGHDSGLVHGKKRSRSESHDIMMMKELELFRRTQMGQEAGERVIAKPSRRGSGRDRPTFQPQEPIGKLVSDIQRLSIQKTDSESEECCSSEEEYTVLSGVTKPATPSDSETASPVPPPNSPTLLQVMRGAGNRSPSPLLHTVLPSALRQVPQYCSVDEETTTCTSPEFQQKISTNTATVSYEHIRNPLLILAKDSPVPEMDYFIIVHTYPPPGLCQKFQCGNTDEVNLLYHCWLYPEVPCDPDLVCSQPLEMGVFQPRGVAPVHQDLDDAGVAFYYLHPRTVCIHDCHFSPENAQLHLLRNHRVHTFFSAARHGARRVVTLHVIPGASEVEDRLREGLGRCSTLQGLLEELTLITPTSTEIIKHLILS